MTIDATPTAVSPPLVCGDCVSWSPDEYTPHVGFCDCAFSEYFDLPRGANEPACEWYCSEDDVDEAVAKFYGEDYDPEVYEL